MPSGIVLLIKFLLDIRSNILLANECSIVNYKDKRAKGEGVIQQYLFDVVFLQSLRCAIDGILLHIL